MIIVDGVLLEYLICRLVVRLIVVMSIAKPKKLQMRNTQKKGSN